MSLSLGVVGALRSMQRHTNEAGPGFDGERLPVSLAASLAVVAARLGADVHFAAGLSEGEAHPELRAPLTAEGIAIHAFELAPGNAAAGALMAHGEEAAEASSSTLSEDTRPSEPPPESLVRALASLASCDLVLVQLELPDRELRWVIDHLNAREQAWHLHAAPARELEPGLLAGSSVLMLSEGAARVLSRSRGNEVSCKGLLRRLAAQGPDRVCLYRPVRGSQAFDGEQLREVDPAGSSPGDLLAAELVFCSSLSLALAQGERTEVALRRSQKFALLPGSGQAPFGGLPAAEQLRLEQTAEH